MSWETAMNNTIKIEIDADLEEIVPGFLTNRRQDILSIETLLTEGDYNAIRIIGHSMKGAGASYGFDFVSEIGRAIETAAETGSGQTVALKINALETFLDQVEIEFVRK